MLPYVSMCRTMPAQVRDSMLALNAVSRGKEVENFDADNHITGSLLNTVLFMRFAYFDASTESLKMWSWQFDSVKNKFAVF